MDIDKIGVKAKQFFRGEKSFVIILPVFREIKIRFYTVIQKKKVKDILNCVGG